MTICECDKELLKTARKAAKDRSLRLYARIWAKITVGVMKRRAKKCPGKPVPKWFRLKVYGNYCGPNYRRPGAKPIDYLDCACQKHDDCYAKVLDR